MLTLFTKIVRAEDVDFIGVEIGALIKKCPDTTSDMLFALLSLRGDISKADFKDVIIIRFFLRLTKISFMYIMKFCFQIEI